jgi:hypothetical protein
VSSQLTGTYDPGFLVGDDYAYTEADVEAAIEAISDPRRLREAQDLVARSVPSLQRVLDAAIADGGWFTEAHDQAVSQATGEPDPQERLRFVRTLLAEETRLGMLVGVAVGFELARQLGGQAGPEPTVGGAEPPGHAPNNSVNTHPED